MKKYRKLNRQFKGSLAQQWAQQDPSGLKASCLRSIGNGADRKIGLGNNARVLAVPESKRAQCQPVITQWSHNQDQFARDYLSGKKSLPGLSAVDVDFVDSYQRSPLASHLSATGKYDLRAKTSYLKKDLNHAFSETLDQLDALKGRLEDAKGTNSYKVYTFKNQFKDFAKDLPPPKDLEAANCGKREGFNEDCFNDSEAGRGGRCAKRFLGLGAEFFPVFGLIDAFQGLSSTGGAQAAGILTTEEATAEKAGYIFQAFSGVPSIGVTGAILKKVASASISAATKSSNAARSAFGGRRQARRTSQAPKDLPKDGLEYKLMLERAGNFTDDERIAETAGLFGRTLSRREANGVLESHRVGIDRPGSGFGRYKPEELDKKLQVLKDAGFSSEEAKELIRRGITGRSPDDVLQNSIRFPKGLADSTNGFGKLTREFIAEHPNYSSTYGKSPSALATRVLREKGKPAIEEAQNLFRKQAEELEGNSRRASARELRISAGDIDHAVDKIPNKKAAQGLRTKWQNTLDEFNRQDKLSRENLAGAGREADQYYSYMRKQYEAAIKELNSEFGLK